VIRKLWVKELATTAPHFMALCDCVRAFVHGMILKQ